MRWMNLIERKKNSSTFFVLLFLLCVVFLTLTIERFADYFKRHFDHVRDLLIFWFFFSFVGFDEEKK